MFQSKKNYSPIRSGPNGVFIQNNEFNLIPTGFGRKHFPSQSWHILEWQLNIDSELLFEEDDHEDSLSLHASG